MVLKRILGGEKIATAIQRKYILYDCKSSDNKISSQTRFKFSALSPLGKLLEFSEVQDIISAGFHTTSGWRFVSYKEEIDGLVITFESVNPANEKQKYTHLKIVPRWYVDV